jgi:hypothetical protein
MPCECCTRITAAEIVVTCGHAGMNVTLADGTEAAGVIRWYVDELTFTTADAIGRTLAELRELHIERDLAYLRS